MVNERHEAIAIFLREDVLLLSHAGVEINLVSKRVDEGANGSFLLETIRHVLEGKPTVAHVEHAPNAIETIAIVISALAALAAALAALEALAALADALFVLAALARLGLAGLDALS